MGFRHEFVGYFEHIREIAKLRLCFRPRRDRDGSVLPPRRTPPTSACLIRTAFRRYRKRGKFGCNCRNGCVKKVMADKGYLRLLARWLVGWTQTPRKARRAVLLEKLKHPSKMVITAPGNDEGATGDIDIVHAGKRAGTTISLLGTPLCQMGFKCCTGVSQNFFVRARKYANDGLVTWKEHNINKCPARANEMRDAIWMVVADLHEQSPYAKAVQSSQSSQSLQSPPDEQPSRLWHMPFHHKVCLWRLVKALYDKGTFFTQEPQYHEFRRLIASPEFKTVIFHRIVDIGRCPKCEFFKWKCASVALELREVWQDALSRHFLLQIQQKKRYAADRAMAASTFPHTELYLAVRGRLVGNVHLCPFCFPPSPQNIACERVLVPIFLPSLPPSSLPHIILRKHACQQNAPSSGSRLWVRTRVRLATLVGSRP